MDTTIRCPPRRPEVLSANAPRPPRGGTWLCEPPCCRRRCQGSRHDPRLPEGGMRDGDGFIGVAMSSPRTGGSGAG